MPSPSRYDSGDFLLALFQRVAERAEQLITARLGSKTDLLTRGQRIYSRQVTSKVGILTFGLLLLVAGPLVYLTLSQTSYAISELLESLRPAPAEKLHQAITDIISIHDNNNSPSASELLQSLAPQSEPDLYTRLLAHNLIKRAPHLLLSNLKASADDTNSFAPPIGSLPDAKRSYDIYLYLSKELPQSFPPLTEKEFARLALNQLPSTIGNLAHVDLFDDCNDCIQAISRQLFLIRRLEPLVEADNAVTLASALAMTNRQIFNTTGMLFAFLILLGLVFAVEIYNQGDLLSIAILERTKEVREHLQYQRAQSKTTQVGFSFSHLTTGHGSIRSLESRPLSLPGLAAELRNYLTDLSTAFSGKVVICIDELDKIPTTTDVDALLAGIKGALGAVGCHFIFTISEDSLDRIGIHNRAVQESTFEEVMFLERVDLELAEHIAVTAVPLAEDSVALMKASAPLFWIYGKGVPRDIKRAVLAFNRARPPASNSVYDAWRLLFLDVLREQRRSVAVHGGESEATSRFLTVIEEIGSVDLQTCPREVAKSLLNTVRTLVSTPYDYTPQFDEQRMYGRAIIELALIGTASLWISNGVIKIDSDAAIELARIYQYLGTNFSFALDRSQSYWALLPTRESGVATPHRPQQLDA